MEVLRPCLYRTAYEAVGRWLKVEASREGGIVKVRKDDACRISDKLIAYGGAVE